MKSRIVCAAIGAVGLMLLAQMVAAEPAQITTQRYLCDRGAELWATYLNQGDTSHAVLTFEGRQMAFDIAVSASGARYVSHDPAQGYVWWTKGESGMLLHGSGDDEALIYAECLPQG